ncbi:MAG: hypothetical protein Q8P17_01020 [bacterium]|nr:hypothetical protein [bacterium]
MLGLQPGDVIARNRNGESLFSVVLVRHEEKGNLSFTISRFSTIVSQQEYPKNVYLDKDWWLVDTSGAIMVLPEEWVATDKDGAKGLLTLRSEKKPPGARDKAKEIFCSLKDGNKSLVKNAEDILKQIGYDSPSREQIELLAFALKCAANRVWEMH